MERLQRGRRSAVLTVRAGAVLEGTKTGDSIAVNGVCLTVTALSGHGFSADVMHETLDRSTLAGLSPGPGPKAGGAITREFLTRYGF